MILTLNQFIAQQIDILHIKQSTSSLTFFRFSTVKAIYNSTFGTLLLLLSAPSKINHLGLPESKVWLWNDRWFLLHSHSQSYRPQPTSNFGCKNSQRSWGDSNPRTSDLESDTLAPYQQAVISPYDLWEFLQPKYNTKCGLRYEWLWECNTNHLSLNKNLNKILVR